MLKSGDKSCDRGRGPAEAAGEIQRLTGRDGEQRFLHDARHLALISALLATNQHARISVRHEIPPQSGQRSRHVVDARRELTATGVKRDGRASGVEVRNASRELKVVLVVAQVGQRQAPMLGPPDH